MNLLLKYSQFIIFHLNMLNIIHQILVLRTSWVFKNCLEKLINEI